MSTLKSTTLALFLAGIAMAADPVGRPPDAAARAAWQRFADVQAFGFETADASLARSLGGLPDGYVVQVEYDAKRSHAVQLKVARNGKNVCQVVGHFGSVFLADDDFFYFASYWTGSNGCRILAFDAKREEQVWATKVIGLGLVEHSQYKNQVSMSMHTLDLPDGSKGKALKITGHESYGDYTEFLDSKTGAVLAQRVYRKGYK